MWASGTSAGGGGFDSYSKATFDFAGTVNGSTWTKLDFDSIEYDNLGEMDIVTNDRWDAAADGYYRIVASGTIEGLGAVAGQGALLKIYKNGVGLERSAVGHAHSAGDNKAVVSVSTSLQLSAGDYIEIYMWHNNASPKLISIPANYCTIERFA